MRGLSLGHGAESCIPLLKGDKLLMTLNPNNGILRAAREQRIERVVVSSNVRILQLYRTEYYFVSSRLCCGVCLGDVAIDIQLEPGDL